MAEQSGGDAQERTEQPTPKRLEDARKKGQIARSRELSTMLVLLGGALILWLSGGFVLNGLADIMRANFTLSHAQIFDQELVAERFVAHITAGVLVLTPILVLTTVVALTAPLALGGWTASAEALAPKFERLDPIKGLKRVLGPKGLMELFKALAKFFLILGFAAFALSIEKGRIFALGGAEVEVALTHAAEILMFSFVVASAATILVALVDVPFQLWQHNKQMRMSRQQVKEENKETEGSPELKGRIRSIQQEVARRRMMEEVPTADVVVTNPEHYAVALKFDSATMNAPRVVARGTEAVAANIRAIAESHGVAIVSAPPLARAIYYTTRINQEVPAGLYVAIARVLAYVFQVRDGVRGLEPPTDLPIPDDLRY